MRPSDSTHTLIMGRGYDTCGSLSSYAGYAETGIHGSQLNSAIIRLPSARVLSAEVATSSALGVIVLPNVNIALVHLA
ncbi:hypothetical protein [Ferrimicrobium acidiphilum]|uniref:hypothetical protein n=1 Tax=Ferrimicrobium acidiphilum TaxID=121039 RepID=UPI0023F1ED4D|nr:hypothetical protein [Ferrimicrobium acidiphilum]